MTDIKRICPKAGCNELIHIRAKYCEKHQAEANKKRRSTAWRPPASQRGYDSRWRKIRTAVLSDCPVCQKCKRAKATEVHHIISLRAGGTHNRDNLVALCKSCHSGITSAAVGGRGVKSLEPTV
jgi:5-methylcytosine-specific restriction enzyme A